MMAKKLLQYYTFDASARTITIDGIYGLDRFLMITNVTDNVIMYIFSNSDFGFSSYSIDTDAETTTVVLDHNTTAMSDTDELQIFIEADGQEFTPAEPYIDAVSKFRVTNPQNLIDTDFEYGLQSTKWETLELVKNIPTFYNRNGDDSLDVISITRTINSDIIDVTTTTDQEHGLGVGNPIIVQGTDSISANGAFVVTKVIDVNNFQYKSKSVQSATGSILDTYTQIFVGSVYQGTEFQLSDLNAITTNAANPSVLTVNTESPTNFSVGTSFFLSNSVGSKTLSFNANTAVNPKGGDFKSESFHSQSLTDSADTSGWAMGHYQPYKWTPKKAKFYVGGTDADATITVDTTANTMTFTDGAHGFSSGDCVMHYNTSGNTIPGGMLERWYYVTAVDANTLKFFFTKADQIADANEESITSAGANGGYTRSCFAEAIKPSVVNTGTEEITFEQNVPYTDTPYAVGYTTVASLQANVAYHAADLDDNYDDYGNGHVVYAASSGQTTTTFSNTPGGTTRNLTAAGIGGCLVPMKPWSGQHEGFSIYLGEGDWKDRDQIQLFHSSTYPSGLAVNRIYELREIGSDYPNRFHLHHGGVVDNTYANGVPVEFSSWGNFGNSFTTIREADWMFHNTMTSPNPATAPIEHIVTVATGLYNVTNSNVFVINSEQHKVLRFQRGYTYRYDQSNSTNATHPLVFSTDAANTTPYTTGVTTNGTPGSAGAYTQITVAADAPDTLYYYCSSHAGMGGEVRVRTQAVEENTGFNYGIWNPYNIQFEDAFYWKCQDECTVSGGVMTYTNAHGLINGKTYAYFDGYENTTAGGLTDSRWYWIKVIDAYSIEVYTTADLTTTKVNVTTAGVHPRLGRSRSAWVRCYVPDSVDTTSDEMTFLETIPGATSGGSQAYIGTYTTCGGLSVLANSNYLVSDSYDDNYFVYPKKVTNSGKTIMFSSEINGTVKNLTNGAAANILSRGAIMKVSLDPASNTFYTDKPELYRLNNIVVIRSNGMPSGVSNGSYDIISKKVGNRIGLTVYSASNAIRRDVTSHGSDDTISHRERTSYYFYTTPLNNASPDSETITIPNHGLNNGDLITYASGGNNIIEGLVDGQTYYAVNCSTNTFKVATTIDGIDRSGNYTVMDFNQSNTYIGANRDIYMGPTTSTPHNFQQGDRLMYLSDTPIPGLQNGGIYDIKAYSNYIRLHAHQEDALRQNNHDLLYFGYPRTGSGTFHKTTVVDLKRRGSSTQTFNASTVGSSDGVYTIDSIVDDTSFTMSAPTQINDRVVGFNSDNGVWVEENAMYLPDHFFVDQQAVVYATTGTVVGGLTSGTTYYLIRESRNWVRLAASAADAVAKTAIPLTSKGVGTHSLTAESISGQTIGTGTVSINSGDSTVTGTGTNFTSFFNTGDAISLYHEPDSTELSVTSVNTSTSVFTTATHGLTTEDMLVLEAEVPPSGATSGFIYYVEVVSTTTFKIYPTAADATANTNAIAVTTAGTNVKFKKLSNIGSVQTGIIKSVTGPGTLELSTTATVSLADVNYAIGTSLLMRGDGFAIHRPYDGGVELIPSKNPDSSMIRQTRRYFRYQSGKSIQVSFAVNFSPSTQIESYTYDSATLLGTIKTRHPHRLASGLSITISGATTTSPTNNWNGTKVITSIVDDYTFTVTQGGALTTDAVSGAGGLPEFYVTAWSNSALRCGLFDDQNGMFFEYDGSALSCCRRSSVVQISGTSAVTFRSGQIVGTNTRYTKQLSVGEKIVIKGQTHVITKITSDTLMFIMPTYRGTSNSNVIITKTEVSKIPQSQWNLDKCDGTGPTGFFLRPHRIQMAYIDYSWYGAGKVRFGFKDQRGRVIYVHEFIHNNKKNEAYLRSGNLPARYEIENVGIPTYVPALAHWGTSVIMDGKFDPDNAYLFTAGSNNIQLTGSSTVTVSAKAETQNEYYYWFNNRWYGLGRALEIDNPSFLYNSIPANKSITGTSVDNNTFTRNPYSWFGLPSQPYQVSLRTRTDYRDSSTEEIRNLLLINRSPTGTATSNSNYTVTTATTGAPVVYDVPLISIRLSPSVDTNTPGFLGEREIINRMQLLLNSLGILSTHNCEVTLRLNGLITNTSWERVQNPSLSQLVYHNNQDTITGGINIFEFRAQGGVGTTGRSALVTDQSLLGTTTLGNSILGGDNVFPDGPDVLTVVAKLSEDPSTVSNTNPFNVTARISWSESQA